VPAPEPERDIPTHYGIEPGQWLARRRSLAGSLVAVEISRATKAGLAVLALFRGDNRVVPPLTRCWRLAIRFEPARAAQGIVARIRHEEDLHQSSASWALGRRPARVPTSKRIRPLGEPVIPQRRSRLRHGREELENPVPSCEVFASSPAELGDPRVRRLRSPGGGHGIILARMFYIVCKLFEPTIARRPIGPPA
jgi:hypothetical protein